MTTWDLNRLRYTIRKITGKYDIVQLPDSSFGEINLSNPAGIDDYINDFYLYDMPEQLRTLRLKDFYKFVTLPNVGTYSIPQNILSVEPPIYIDNYQFAWYQSPDIFYRIWPELNFINRNLFSPNGSLNTFTFFLTQTPVQQGTVVIGLNPNQNIVPSQSPVLENFTDRDYPVPLDLPTQQFFVNPGLLLSNLYTGDINLPYNQWGVIPGTGSINYLSGQVILNYINTPPAGINTSCHYHPYVASRPRDIMMYQQQLFLRPIPNDSYSVKLMSYQMPTTVISSATNAINIPAVDQSGNIQGFTNSNSNSNSTNLPMWNEWWQLIAYGAALKIFIEDGDHEEHDKYLIHFEKQKLLAQRKELKQLANQRIQTAYSDNNMGSAQWPIFPIY
jgi:hypothetical protein